MSDEEGILTPATAVARTATCIIIFAAFGPSAAAERPVIEIHPVVDCSSNQGASPLALPGLSSTDRYGKPFSPCLSRDVIIGSADIIQARHTKGRTGDSLTISVSADGQRRFYEYALNHPLEPIAIFVDGRLVSAPLLGPAGYPRTFEISGDLSAAEIDALVERFQANP